MLTYFLKVRNVIQLEEILSVSFSSNIRVSAVSHYTQLIFYLSFCILLLSDKIFKHLFQPCRFNNWNLETSRNASLRHCYLFWWAKKLLKYDKITIFRDFQPKLCHSWLLSPKLITQIQILRSRLKILCLHRVRFKVNLKNATDIVISSLVPWPDKIWAKNFHEGLSYTEFVCVFSFGLKNQQWLKVRVENYERLWFWHISKALQSIQTDENVSNRHLWKILSPSHRARLAGTQKFEHFFGQRITFLFITGNLFFSDFLCNIIKFGLYIEKWEKVNSRN